MIKSFSQYIVEADAKAVTFVFGRFNPPTNGHEILFDKLKSISKGSYRIYCSKSEDPKKNPLQFKDKVKFLRKMFPKHARSVMADKDVRTAMDICVKLYDQGFTSVTMIAGSDRLKEFDVLGPVDAPIFRVKNRFRTRLLIRSNYDHLIQKNLSLVLQNLKISKKIKLTVDVDPINFT